MISLPPKRCMKRFYSAPPKRFYKKTGVLHSGNGHFEITLDNRKLKTPKGEVLKIENELLALGVAAEWDSQKGTIQRSEMHLTKLCNTAQDNPHSVKKFDAVERIVNFLEIDTILYHSADGDELSILQKKEWGPAIDWFRERLQVDLEPTTSLVPPRLPDATRDTLRRHLLSYNLNAVHGFTAAVEALKSVILMMCCIDRRLSVEQAVLLTTLEEEYQAGFWGRVEWAHDSSRLELQARVAAAVLFARLNSFSEDTRGKLVSIV